MNFVHNFRHVSFFGVVALCCLPVISSAQKADTPIYADDLTRDAVGPIQHVDNQVPAEARMKPGPQGRMVVMGAKTDVWCPPGKFIELVPNMNIVGFTPVTITLYDGLQVHSQAADSKDILRVDPPVGGVNRKVVTVKAFDAQGHDTVLMQCTVRSRISKETIATLDYEENKEKCSFKIKDRDLYTNTCLYMGEMYLGRVEETAGKIEVDERRLPPGHYTCQMVGKNSDDIYVPGATTEFDVKPRYQIECAGAEREIVIGEHADETLKVKISHTPGLSIKKTRVYIAGIRAEKDIEGDDFTVNLPTKDVPTGKCFIEVVGIGDDGFTYPVESIPINIKNEPWDSRFTHSVDYERMQSYQAKIDELWQEVRSNMTRASHEPGVYMDTKTITLESITKHYKVGKSAEFYAAAEKAFIQMTQNQLKLARVCRTMKMLTRACFMFKNVVREMGVSTPDGLAAKTELDALRKPDSSVL